MMMRLEYQLTFEDFREAQLGQRPSAGRRVRGRALVAWILFLVLALLVLTLVRHQQAGRRGRVFVPPEPPAAPLAWRMGAAMAPSLLFFGVMAWVAARSLRQPFPKPWEQPAVEPRKPAKATFSAGRLVVVLAVAAVAMAVILFTGVRASRAQLPGAPTPPWRLLTVGDYLIGTIPWALMIALLVVIAGGNRGARGWRKLWDAQPFLHPPKVAEFSDTGVVIADALSRIEHRWANFAGFKETPAVFILYLSPVSFHLVPRRAFAAAGPEALDAFRALLLNHVKHGHFLEQPSAFAVVPFATPAPAGPSGAPAR